jgi:hypothetical protein
MGGGGGGLAEGDSDTGDFVPGDNNDNPSRTKTPLAALVQVLPSRRQSLDDRPWVLSYMGALRHKVCPGPDGSKVEICHAVRATAHHRGGLDLRPLSAQAAQPGV